MERIQNQRKQVVPSAVARMAGHATVTQEQAIKINQQINLKIYGISCITGMPEDHAFFLSLPFGEAQYSAQLIYLLQRQDASEATIYALDFHPDFFLQWKEELMIQQKAFRFDRTAEQQFPLCKQSEDLLQELGYETSENEFSHLLHLTEIALHLFRRAIDQLNIPFTACNVPACRFLAFESEREKIALAQNILNEEYDETISIKVLSRRVAMNECYLKKGFKAVTGQTIHEYRQNRRIAHARLMLQEESKSVTEVAALLGYSSISHFSTAFKRATGLKPCELLN